MSDIFVSVIVPVYNQELYVGECISSILNNTYSNFELIIVDDGSTDSSFEIVSSFKDSRIVIIKKENGGLSSARNAGLKVAHGDYITFIDSDDLINSKYLEILSNQIEQNNADIVYCKFMKFNDNIPLINFEDFKVQKLTIDEFYNSDSYVYKVISCAKFFNKRIFEKINFEFGRLHEDEFFYGSLFEVLKNDIIFVDLPLYCYRENLTSITHTSPNNKRLIDSCDALLMRLKIFYRNAYRNNDAIGYCLDALMTIVFRKGWKHKICKRASIIRKRFYYKFKFSNSLKNKLTCLPFIIAPLLCFLFRRKIAKK